VLRELAPGVDVEQVRASTGPPLTVDAQPATIGVLVDG
jgi:acyl CoA:acetate/3-ketoacid CoA transferase beta subunit